MHVEPDYVFVSAHDTTQAGLLVGTNYVGMETQVIGINQFNDDSKALIKKIADDIVDLLDLDMQIGMDAVFNTTDYVGPGYGIPTPECLDAIKLVARTEGIFLDPVYTGKAMAGLIDYMRRGDVEKQETVIFVHTGGFPALFAYNEELVASLDQRPVIR
jgi:1-aminocyclopropane-1-carboxylate deaminase/D-cysteine desulfhydrase-like pyridoxal-dependent ACC family enzyme